jgi:emfourin
MKLTVERGGGFAGLNRRVERDGQDLSPEQHAALDRVIKDNATPSAQPLPQDAGADRFTYRLEIQDEKGTRSITLPESKMPKELKGIVTQ